MPTLDELIDSVEALTDSLEEIQPFLASLDAVKAAMQKQTEATLANVAAIKGQTRDLEALLDAHRQLVEAIPDAVSQRILLNALN